MLAVGKRDRRKLLGIQVFEVEGQGAGIIACSFSPSTGTALGLAEFFPAGFHVLDVFDQSIFIHTGRASEITKARYFGGRSPGVIKSTGTPSISSSSIWRPPRSNRVTPGSGSTSMSRSLPSRSSPCTTEPNTRGFATLNLTVARRMAARLTSSAAEGFMDCRVYRGRAVEREPGFLSRNSRLAHAHLAAQLPGQRFGLFLRRQISYA